METELKKSTEQFSEDILIYIKILAESLNQQLIKSLKANEHNILNTMKQIAYKGESQLSVFFVLAHIYKTTFVYDSDHAEFSLEHCIDDYLYEERLFGKKQVRYTQVNYKKYYRNLCSKINIYELKIIDDILNKNPSITIDLKSYFESLGLSTTIRINENFLIVDLSF